MIYDIRPLQDQVSSTPTNFVSAYGDIEAFGGGKTEYTERRSTFGTAEATTCPFGSIITYPDGTATATGILGGVIFCGESNIEVPNQELDLATDGDWLMWIEIDCIANRDDDNEIFLPGMKSATAPASNWDKVTWSESASYPDNTNPTVATGAGSIIVPIGRLKIEDGSATLVNTGCGHIRIDQCAGILTHTRE